MPPIFEEKRFNFEKGQKIPEHIDKSPGGRDRDRSKYAVLAELVGANLFFPVAIDVGDEATAELLAQAHRTEDGIKNNYVAHVVSPLTEN